MKYKEGDIVLIKNSTRPQLIGLRMKIMKAINLGYEDRYDLFPCNKGEWQLYRDALKDSMHGANHTWTGMLDEKLAPISEIVEAW